MPRQGFALSISQHTASGWEQDLVLPLHVASEQLTELGARVEVRHTLSHALIGLISERPDPYVLLDKNAHHPLTDHRGDPGEQVFVLGSAVHVQGCSEDLDSSRERTLKSHAVMLLDSFTQRVERLKHIDMLALKPVDEQNQFTGQRAPSLGRLV